MAKRRLAEAGFGHIGVRRLDGNASQSQKERIMEASNTSNTTVIFSDTGIQNEGNAHCDSHLLLVCMTNSYRCVSDGRDIALHNTFDLF